MTTNAISNILNNLGIRKNTRGYQYLFLAISLLLDEPDLFEDSFQTKLYPEIGKIYNRTPGSIVSTLQYVVNIALDNGNPNLLCEILGKPVSELSRRPTCAKFLLKVVNYLKED